MATLQVADDVAIALPPDDIVDGGIEIELGFLGVTERKADVQCGAMLRRSNNRADAIPVRS